MAAVKRERQKTGEGVGDAAEVSTVDSQILGVMSEVCVDGIKEGVDSSLALFQELSGEH